jgi:hypothetical protein
MRAVARSRVYFELGEIAVLPLATHTHRATERPARSWARRSGPDFSFFAITTFTSPSLAE